MQSENLIPYNLYLWVPVLSFGAGQEKGTDPFVRYHIKYLDTTDRPYLCILLKYNVPSPFHVPCAGFCELPTPSAAAPGCLGGHQVPPHFWSPLFW